MNPVTPKSKKQLIYPIFSSLDETSRDENITSLRVKEMIANSRTASFLDKFSS